MMDSGCLPTAQEVKTQGSRNTFGHFRTRRTGLEQVSHATQRDIAGCAREGKRGLLSQRPLARMQMAAALSHCAARSSSEVAETGQRRLPTWLGQAGRQVDGEAVWSGQDAEAPCAKSADRCMDNPPKLNRGEDPPTFIRPRRKWPLYAHTEDGAHAACTAEAAIP